MSDNLSTHSLRVSGRILFPSWRGAKPKLTPEESARRVAETTACSVCGAKGLYVLFPKGRHGRAVGRCRTHKTL